ncbi:MAG TPA: ATP-binding protein [Acidimicrobiales bacterium]|nr:ATP-binding protein [Acidimicrobiales bacterium]
MQCRTFAPVESEIAAVRRFVAQAAGSCPCDADMAALVASELATNAVLHARSAFTVTVWPGDDGITIEVLDENPRRPSASNAGPRDLSGRGLQLIDAVCDAWGVRPNDDGKAVWAHLT